MFRALARVFSFFCQKKDSEERRKDDDEILLKGIKLVLWSLEVGGVPSPLGS